MLQDIWYGDNRAGTGWTMDMLNTFVYHEDFQEQKRKLKPQKGGKLFVIKRKDENFQWEMEI